MASSPVPREAAGTVRRRRPRLASPPAMAVRPGPAVSRGRFWRGFIIFVACLAVLAVGRVAISFAVVQKTVATEAVAREERRVAAENGQLAEKLAELGSTVRIRGIAENRLGLVDAKDVQYLTIGVGTVSGGAATATDGAASSTSDGVASTPQPETTP